LAAEMDNFEVKSIILMIGFETKKNGEKEIYHSSME